SWSAPLEPTYPQILAYWARLARVIGQLRSSFDVFQINTADFYHVGTAPVARILGKPVVVRSSIAGEFANLGRSRSGRLQRHLLRAAGAIVALSSQIAAEAADAGMPSRQLNVIPNGVDTSIYHPVTEEVRSSIRRQLGLPESGRIMVYHGVFIERKMLHWLVKTLESRLAALDMTLLFVGGPAREEPVTG